MNISMHEALFGTKLDDGRIRCELCPHHCTLQEGQDGICGNRGMREGKLQTLHYQLVATPGQVDPIEKKPLFNFHPGSKVLSFGGIGCNLKCHFCQNCEISQLGSQRTLYEFSADKILELARLSGCDGVAWTYNEPTIWFETNYEWSVALKEQGLYTVYVTNGYIEAEPLKRLAPVLDAMNIDVKAFNPDFYRNIAHAKLEPVLNTCVLAKELGLHIELTYLLIPGHNDSPEELNRYLDWVAQEIGYRVPLHFSAFHPDYQMTAVPPTSPQKVLETVKWARDKGFLYVYSGNLRGGEESTYCPQCQAKVISRSGYYIGAVNLDQNACCTFCGTQVDVIM